MRAVLGLLFLMGGFTVAYVVLSGKIPQLGTTSPTTSPSSLPTTQSLQQTQSQMINKNQGAGGPMGMSLGPNTNDITGTTGGFY